MTSIKHIVILGGGTAGWMTAAALSHFVSPNIFSLTVVESKEIGRVGVGEATVPHILEFNAMLGISEQEFMRSVSATYKLGIRFKGWGSEKNDYFHPFGGHGSEINNIPFHHFWLKARSETSNTSKNNLNAYDNFSFSAVAARKNRFAHPNQDQRTLSSSYSYAYHLDANAYAHFLQNYALANGVKRTEGKVAHIELNKNTGDIMGLVFEDGSQINGNLFVDCSGFASLLLGQTLKVPFKNWSHWLPCDAAYAVQSELTSMPAPYTLSQAEQAGWQWRIPLQRRMGNGHVYCREYMSDSEALRKLEESIEGQLITSARQLRFTAGMYSESWVKNCVAIGLSSGFLEPLESTSIYLIQFGIYKLLELLPSCETINQIERDEFNREVIQEYEGIRDFLILHYKQNNRNDSDFWRYCNKMSIPDSLAHKISLFHSCALFTEEIKNPFKQSSWLAIFLGQGLTPKTLHPLLSGFSEVQVKSKLDEIYNQIQRDTETLPRHFEVLQKYILNQDGATLATDNLKGITP